MDAGSDAVGFEDDGRGHEPRKAGSLWKLEKARQRISSRASEGAQPCPHLDFMPVKFISDF